MSSFKILVSKDFLLLKALLSIIYIALELYYHHFISVDFKYMGYIPDLNLFKYLLTKIIFISFLILSYDLFKRSEFLYVIYLLLLFFFYIPNAILFSFSDMAASPFISNVFFVSVFLITPYIKFSIPYIIVPLKYKIIALITISILLLIPIIATFKLNINLNTFFLSEIYETRDIFSENLKGYLNYFYHFEVKTIIPIALVFFMIRKKPFFIILFIIMLLYLFVISGNKLVYFTTIIVIYFYYIGKSYISKISYFFLFTIILFALFPIIDNYILNSSLLGGVFVNRMFFIPALLTHWYFDFFDGNPFYFAESHFFNLFVESPYDTPVGFLITKVYWNQSAAYANNGIVSDGFMNLGYLGVIIFSMIFSLLFSLFNSFNLHKGFFGIFFSYIYILLSAPLLTCFITGGILPFIILCFFVLNNRKTKLLNI